MKREKNIDFINGFINFFKVIYLRMLIHSAIYSTSILRNWIAIFFECINKIIYTRSHYFTINSHNGFNCDYRYYRNNWMYGCHPPRYSLKIMFIPTDLKVCKSSLWRSLNCPLLLLFLLLLLVIPSLYLLLTHLSSQQNVMT